MTSRVPRGLLKPIISNSTRVFTTIPRPYPRLPRTLQPPLNTARRLKHSIPRPPQRPAPPSSESSNPSDGSSSSSSSSSSSPPRQEKTRKQLEPHYQLTFTCVPCGGRSSHTISKQGYHHGSVLITCPSCRNRHIISDHLGIFGDRKITVEDLMRERGRLVKRGTLGEDGDVEFWADETASNEEGGAAAEEAGALAGEQEATRPRETRDPSAAQSSTNGAAPPSPLGAGGARPSVASTSPTRSTPSTRREYSTGFLHFRRVWVKTNFVITDWQDALREDVEEEPKATFKVPQFLGDKKARPFQESNRRPTQAASRAAREGPNIIKVQVGMPKDVDPQEIQENIASYHGWTTLGSAGEQLRPNEVFAQNIAEGQKSPITRLPEDDARPLMLARRRLDKIPSEGFNVFSKVVPRRPEDEKLPQGVPPIPEISRKSQMLADTIERAAAAGPSEPGADDWWSDESSSLEAGRPSRIPESEIEVADPRAEIAGGTVAESIAQPAADPSHSDHYPVEEEKEEESISLIRHVASSKARSLPFTPRSIVPPWERRAVFGPKVSPNTKASGGRRKKSKGRSGKNNDAAAADVWGNKAMSADLRKLIEWGTPAEIPREMGASAE